VLREVEILDQFRITVQQLEVCRTLVLQGGEAECRGALILLDHVSEVILHRILQEEIEEGRIYPKGYPGAIPTKEASPNRASVSRKT
jgi:hypothetical protein